MRELVAISYEGPHKADEVYVELVKMQKAHLIDLGDAAVVVKQPQGQVRFKHFRELHLRGEQAAGFWGVLLGFLFLNPGLGGLLGASAGERATSLEDFGISDDFIRRLGESLNPGNSALFILVRHAEPDRVLEELKPFGGTVLRTSLSAEDETRLKEALDRRG